MRVKVCGITRPADAASAIQAGADALGLVFAAGKRRVSLETAAAIAAAVPPWFPVVGVFKDAPVGEVRAALAAVRLTHVQLHGAEDLAYLDLIDRPVIKAVPLVTEAHEEAARALVRARPGLQLLADAAEGGSGRACDWVRAERLARECALILAGGLSPQNVGAAIAAVRPAAVDVSSGVEASPGVKDPALIRAFLDAARAVSL